jgi:ATP-dependent Clp protease ATP-binding subunit ClpA
MIFFDLKQEAARKTIGDVASRETELSRLGRTVHRQYNNNVLISGQSGIGKTSLVEAFAYRASLGKIPGITGAPLIRLDSNELRRMSSSSEGLSQIASGLQSLPVSTILFIDDYQVAAEAKQVGMESVLHAVLQRIDIALVMTISEQGYQKLLADNPNFLKHFEHIPLSEPDAKQTAVIVSALAASFGVEYKILISPAVAAEAASLSQKLSSSQHQPLRAIHFLDECLAYAKMSGATALLSAHVRYVFAETTGIPSETLNASDADFLRSLEPTLNKHVIGQPHAVHAVADVIRRSRMGLRNPNRPYGSFLFLGTSGVGKTELAKTLAKTVYGSERLFTRIDMSEFSEAHTVQRLTGAPPGYIGFEAGGQLTNAAQEHPYSLILLDEIEKANPKIFDIFLQVFDDGRLTDGRGHTAQFTNSILIATSNIGVEEIITAIKNNEDVSEPDFDSIIVFNPLGQEELLEIAQLEIRNIEARTAEHNIAFNIDPDILRKKIIDISDPRLGARPIKRFVEQTCERLIAMKLMEQQ